MTRTMCRLGFALCLTLLVTTGLLTTPAPLAAVTCPALSCSTIISACNQLGGVQGVYPQGTCTEGSSTYNYYYLVCPGVPFYGVCTAR